ncbi:MAG: hypothetical protein ACE5H1_00770 [Thermodesulfobacteriota bacterium]
MELKDQVISLDIAKRLKELGVPQESLFYWVPEYTVNMATGKKLHRIITDETVNVLKKRKEYEGDFVSAFTLSELGELLPFEYSDTCKGKDGVWMCCHMEAICDDYACEGDEIEITFNECEEADTEANARGLMLIYLLDQGIIKL